MAIRTGTIFVYNRPICSKPELIVELKKMARRFEDVKRGFNPREHARTAVAKREAQKVKG